MTSFRIRLPLVSGLVALAIPGVPSDLDERFQSEVRPLLERHCYRCHNDQVSNAEVNLSAFRDHTSVVEGRKTWERVLRVLREKEMPPV